MRKAVPLALRWPRVERLGVGDFHPHCGSRGEMLRA